MIHLQLQGFGYVDDEIPKMLNWCAETLIRYSTVCDAGDVLVVRGTECPMCCRSSDPQYGSIIVLTTEDLHYGQWLYQFAHEYTHHLIGGAKSGEIRGQLWFEETLCEIASRFAIHTLAHSGLCSLLGLHRAFPVLRDYHTKHLAVSESLHWEYLRNGSFAKWLPLLQNPSSGYLREHYCVIADAFLPLFRTNPGLWSIIAHIGDSRQWRTLSELFAHLHLTVCRTEAASLINMQMMFLS